MDDKRGKDEGGNGDPSCALPLQGSANAGRAADADTRNPSCRPMSEGEIKDIEFLDTMSPETAERYWGEWIAVDNGRVVAHGKDPGQVCDRARAAGASAPYMRYIGEDIEMLPGFYLPE